MAWETREKIEHTILKCYSYGSRVYGVNNPASDYDFILVVKPNESDPIDFVYSVENHKANVDFKVYSESLFIKNIEAHTISVLECIFQKQDDPYVGYFKLNYNQLRHAISSASSVSYVKCKKKMKENYNYNGKKSMYHSLRILNFGIQIAKYGRIVKYSSANHFNGKLFAMGNDWDEIDKQFKPIYNMLKTHFKKVAPMEVE